MKITDAQGATYQILTPDLTGGLELEGVTLDQIRKLPGGNPAQPLVVPLTWSYAAGKSGTLKGYDSAKASHRRPLQGVGVTGSGVDAQRVLTGTGTATLTLWGGLWTIS